MSRETVSCSFYSTRQTVATPFIAGIDGHICEECVRWIPPTFCSSLVALFPVWTG